MIGFDIVYLKDPIGNVFATRINNIMVIGKGKEPWVALPKDKGIYLNVLEKM